MKTKNKAIGYTVEIVGGLLIAIVGGLLIALAVSIPIIIKTELALTAIEFLRRH